MTNTKTKDYGKWFQISLIIANNSIVPIEFDPELIKASLLKANRQAIVLDVWSSDRYMRKVRRTQNLNMVLLGIGEGLATANAGYSTSTTHTNTYHNYPYPHNSISTSRTIRYDAAAAYQAQVIASNRMANYENSLYNERDIKQKGYLKKTTIYPGEAISGYVNIKRISGVSMTVYVDINGAIYAFPWNIEN